MFWENCLWNTPACVLHRSGIEISASGKRGDVETGTHETCWQVKLIARARAEVPMTQTVYDPGLYETGSDDKKVTEIEITLDPVTS